jgi:hypothetical protein
MAQKPIQAAVLNTLAAAGAQVVLAGGKLKITDVAGTANVIDPIRVADGNGYAKIAYAAGTASVKTYNLSVVTLSANTTYSISIEIPGRVDFASGAGQEANQLFAIRTYTISSGNTAPTAANLRDAFIDAVNNDLYAGVTASNSSGDLRFTLDDVNYGDFFVTAPAGTTETVNTAYVAPAGTPTILAKYVSPSLIDNAGQYTTWKISFDKRRRHAALSGGQGLFPEYVFIFVKNGVTNFAGFETALDDVLDGTHTPVADYLGF